MRGAYCSVSARYCASAVAASTVRSGRTPGKAWPISKAMLSGGAAAGSVGDNWDERRAKAGGCIDAPADENVFVRTISTGHIYGWRQSRSSGEFGVERYAWSVGRRAWRPESEVSS